MKKKNKIRVATITILAILIFAFLYLKLYELMVIFFYIMLFYAWRVQCEIDREWMNKDRGE